MDGGWAVGGRSSGLAPGGRRRWRSAVGVVGFRPPPRSPPPSAEPLPLPRAHPNVAAAARSRVSRAG
jgi:hypothetical protein